jgi:hypothetical protein
MTSKTIFAVLFVLPAFAGCNSTSDVLRYDGVTTGAGDAVAANTVMQMVDPWPAGVENPHLRVPADRGGIQGESQRSTGTEATGAAAL